MKDLRVFTNDEFGTIRMVQLNNETYFVGKDVAKALGYVDTVNALKQHVAEEDKVMGSQNTTPYILDSMGRKQYPTFVNESGLYALIFGSKLESAKRFKHWVTSEVLPSIRKHGMYAVDELLENPDIAIKAFTALKEEREKNRVLQLENDRMKPKEIFADAVSVSNTYILIGELAKIIKQNGVNIGQNRLFSWMRDKGYLISRKGIDYNMPTQKSMDLKLFEIKERAINNPDGSVRITKTVLVTGKGQQYFINKFLNVEERSA